jgi:hypothetical protein
MGGAQQAYGPDDWPRGIDAYRRLYNWLERQGQGDLRSLLIENEIAQSMDALISRAQNGTAEGLRALGVTAQLDVERFRRMAIVAPGAMMLSNGFYDRSPPLEAFLQALELFAQTFTPAGGLRLLRIARPPILLYGIYDPNLLEDDQQLVDLIMIRGNLATIFDGLFTSGNPRAIEPQVLLDMLLLELDRGIDLLALGERPDEKGPTETRAVAYWLIVRVILELLAGQYIHPYNNHNVPQSPFPANLLPAAPLDGPISDDAKKGDHTFDDSLIQIQSAYHRETAAITALKRQFEKYLELTVTKIPPPHLAEESVREELSVQWSLEERWQDLVRTVAPEASNQRRVFDLLRLVIKQANFDAAQLANLPKPKDLYEDRRQALPPQFEQSLQEIVRNQRPHRRP